MAKKTIANLNIQLSATSATLRRDLDSATGSVRNFASRVSAAARTLVLLFGITGSFGGLGFAAKLAADAEQMSVSFRVMIGDVRQADALLRDLQKFAAATPFQLPELQDAARKLLAFNEPVSQIVDTLRRIGDVSSGIGAPIGEIAELYGKARVQGRLFMQDINQLTGRGIPIIQELAKQFKVSESAVRDLVEKGKVSFANLEEAFKSLTGEGGKFAGLMEAQSATLAGQWSTLKDNVEALFREIGTKLLPVFKAAVAAASELTAQIGSMDAGTVKTILQITAFAAAFGIVISVVPRVVAGIRAIIVTVRALTTAMAIAQAMTGVGALKVAASLVAAAGAAYATGALFDKFSSDAAAASTAAASAAAETEKMMASVAVTPPADVGPSADELAKQKEQLAAMKKEMEEWASTADRIRDSVRSPFEEQAAAIGEAREALRRNLIDMETYRRVEAKSLKELADADKAAEEKRRRAAVPRNVSVGAALRGTTEGVSAVAAGTDALRALRDEMRKEVESAKRREELLKAIEKHLADKAKEPTVKIDVKKTTGI